MNTRDSNNNRLKVGRVLKGLHNTRKMEEQIEEFVHVILDHTLDICTYQRKTFSEKFVSTNCSWEVRVEPTSVQNKIWACCHLFRSGKKILGWKSEKNFECQAENIQDVHDGLILLMAGMILKLPEIEIKLQPLLRAASHTTFGT